MVEKSLDRGKLVAFADDKELIGRAFDFALRAHRGQKRRDGSDFILHPYRVALELAGWRMDDITLASGLLHDVVEDTGASKEMLEEEFGGKIAEIVSALTKIKGISYVSSDVENLRSLIVAMSRDVRVIIVRLADKLDNMRTIEFLDAEHRRKFSRAILDIYAPLAHRLGMNIVKTELENRAFEVIYPDEFLRINRVIKRLHPRAQKTIERAEKKLYKRLEEEGVRIEKIKGRVKSPLSIFRKCEIQKKEFEEIEDIVAVRIIVSQTDDCYRALAVLHSLFDPVEGSFTDYISYPKMNMYQSIHTTVRFPEGEIVEFQIRTEEMDKTAEFGIASHWRYKELSGRPARGLKEWLSSFYEWQSQNISREEFLENLKTELSYDEIFVLTPKSDVKRLIKGATPIDFAYAIHTDIGNHYHGALVGGKMVPMSRVLQSGDKVKILTSSSSHPTRDWLKFARTPKARYKIRHWLRTVRK